RTDREELDEFEAPLRAIALRVHEVVRVAGRVRAIEKCYPIWLREEKSLVVDRLVLKRQCQFVDRLGRGAGLVPDPAREADADFARKFQAFGLTLDLVENPERQLGIDCELRLPFNCNRRGCNLRSERGTRVVFSIEIHVLNGYGRWPFYDADEN